MSVVVYGYRTTGMDAELQVGEPLRKGTLGFPFKIVAVFPIIKKLFIALETWSHMSEGHLIAEMELVAL